MKEDDAAYLLGIIRMAMWERVKGELYALTRTYELDNQAADKITEEIEYFIRALDVYF